MKNYKWTTGIVKVDDLDDDSPWLPSIDDLGSKLLESASEGEIGIYLVRAPLSIIKPRDEFWYPPEPFKAPVRGALRQLVRTQGAWLLLYQRGDHLVMFDDYGKYQACLDIRAETATAFLLGEPKLAQVETLGGPLVRADAHAYATAKGFNLGKYLEGGNPA